jgi:hypothetical protein
LNFICIEKENIQPTFMEVIIAGQIITQKVPVNVPLKIIFTTQTGELTHECILSINKKMVEGRRKIYLLENKKEENKNEQQ